MEESCCCCCWSGDREEEEQQQKEGKKMVVGVDGGHRLKKLNAGGGTFSASVWVGRGVCVRACVQVYWCWWVGGGGVSSDLTRSE